MKNKNILLTASALLLSLSTFAQTGAKITEKFPLSGDGKWDYLAVSGNRLYVSHGTRVHILDKETGKEINTINNLSGVHGIAIDKENNHGYISNGKMNNVVVFDLTSFKEITTIKTGNNPDFIILEPFTHNVITGNGKSHSLSVIDTKTMAVKTTIEITGKPEAIVSDKTGKIYVNLEDKNAIAVVNIKDYKVEKYITLQPNAEEPAGLAIDAKNHFLFAGCGSGQLLVLNILNDKVIGKFPIGEDCDGVVFNENTKTIYASNAGGSIDVIMETATGKLQQLPSIKTQAGAKTIALDQTTNTLFLSVADFTGKKDANGKPEVVPGTFKVLKVK